MSMNQTQKLCKFLKSSKFKRFYTKKYIALLKREMPHYDIMTGCPALFLFCPLQMRDARTNPNIIIFEVSEDRLKAICELLVSDEFNSFYKEYVLGEYDKEDPKYYSEVEKIFTSVFNVE